VAFWSRKFISVERNYPTHDQELLAIVQAFKHWRHYLEGSALPIEVYTDHANLAGFANQQGLNGRQARWAMALCPYDFVVKHRPGVSNPADGHSGARITKQRCPRLVKRQKRCYRRFRRS